MYWIEASTWAASIWSRWIVDGRDEWHVALGEWEAWDSYRRRSWWRRHASMMTCGRGRAAGWPRGSICWVRRQRHPSSSSSSSSSAEIQTEPGEGEWRGPEQRQSKGGRWRACVFLQGVFSWEWKFSCVISDASKVCREGLLDTSKK
jgi:hypothetical protein